MEIANKQWFIYIVQCSDDSLYTGITINIERRIREHNTSNKAGARSLRGKRPVKLIYFEEVANQSEALRREKKIKSWKREYKFKLILNKNQGLS